MDLSQHDMEELKVEAEKALAFKSPHAKASVLVDAEKLLVLVERVMEHERFLSAKQRLYDRETEQTIEDLTSQIQQLRDQLDELEGK